MIKLIIKGYNGSDRIQYVNKNFIAEMSICLTGDTHILLNDGRYYYVKNSIEDILDQWRKS